MLRINSLELRKLSLMGRVFFFFCSVPQLVPTVRPQPRMVYPLVIIQEARWCMRRFKEVLLSSSSLTDCPALLRQTLILRVQFIHLIRIPFSFYGIQKDLFFFNWSKVALKCCVSVYCTTKGIGYMYPYIPSLLSFPLTHLISPL